MAEEIDFENGRNSNFEGLVTLTLTFDPAIRHTVVHHSSTSTYIPNFIQIEETFCGRTDVRTDGRTGGRTNVRTGERTFFPSILLGRLSEVDLNKSHVKQNTNQRTFCENVRQNDFHFSTPSEWPWPLFFWPWNCSASYSSHRQPPIKVWTSYRILFLS